MYYESNSKLNDLYQLLDSDILLFLIFFIIVVQIVLCVITYKMAVNRGRNGVAWIFLFLCIGILAIIILACVGNANSNYYKYEKGFSWVCPQCMTTNYSGGKCKKCGRPRTSTYTANPTTRKTDESSWVCEKCGAKNVNGAKNCTNCYAPRQ